jgi:hypothetical protein
VDIRILLVKSVPIVDRRGVPIKPVTIIANRLGRTTSNPFLDASNLLWNRRLLENIRDARAIIASDIVGSALTAEVAICALVGDVIFAWNVQRVSMGEFRHAYSPQILVCLIFAALKNYLNASQAFPQSSAWQHRYGDVVTNSLLTH